MFKVIIAGRTPTPTCTLNFQRMVWDYVQFIVSNFVSYDTWCILWLSGDQCVIL